MVSNTDFVTFTNLIAFCVAMMAVTVVTSSAVVTLTMRWFLSRPAARASPSTTVNTGSGAQVNLGVARDMVQAPEPLYTTIQVYEDALASLSQASEAIQVGQEIAAAVRAGRYRGDALDAIDAVLAAIAQPNRNAAYIIRQGRDNKYAYRTTQAGLTRESRDHVVKGKKDGAGNGVKT